jgi:hypothetical protein
MIPAHAPRSRTLPLLALGLCAVALLAAPAARAKDAVVNAADADQHLKRGDILFKYLGAKTKITKSEVLIQTGQKAIRTLSGAFHKELKKGDPKAFHVVVYLGNGRTAEAHGGDIATARVGTRSLDEHDGYLFHVFRPKDQALANEAATVAETWATSRMKYKVPVAVGFSRSNYGPEAREEALKYGKAAHTKGGPPSVDAMFCDEFGIAVYQAAAAARALAKNPGLKSKDLSMPSGLDLQASHASVMAFYAQLEVGKAHGTWTEQGAVVVDK